MGDPDDEALARAFQPVRSDELRAVLGGSRRALAEDIEGWLPFARREPKSRWTHALEEMRRGLDAIYNAVKYLGPEAWERLPGETPIPLRPRRGGAPDFMDVRFFTPEEIFLAGAWLEFWLPRRGAHRPKDAERVWVGVRLVEIFAAHNEPATLGRLGLYAETLRIVLRDLGHQVPKDPLHLLRRIRAEHSRRRALPALAPAPRRRVK